MSEQWMKGLKTLCSARSSFEKTGQIWSVFLSPERILEAARRLYDEEYFIEDISVVDTADGFLVVYHFDHFDGSSRVALRCLVPHDNPRVPSIASVFTGADWHERESHDFFGIEFTGHPNLIPLLLPDDLGFHPLIKEEKARVPLKDLMEPGEIVECDPGFTLFPEEAKEAESEKPAKEATQGS